MIINVISRKNGAGLNKDIRIISENIRSNTRFIPFSKPGIIPKADVNLFIEVFDPKFMSSSPKNFIIPNQEWFYDTWKPYIPQFDLILCKTRLAEQRFSSLGGKCVFTSFTSYDHYLPLKKSLKLFHSSNNSKTKGTKTIIDLYNRYPDLPPITIISRKINWE